MISDEVISQMIHQDDIEAHKNRALNPENPFMRGTSQDSSMFFESREAINSYYDNCPAIVQIKMDEFANLTGRQYHTN